MRSVLAAATAAVLLLLVSGCGGPPAAVPPQPTPSSTTLFASDEEALAAAEDAYEAYLGVLDNALATYEEKELEGVATGQALREALDSVKEFRSDGRRLVGKSSLASAELVQYDADGGVTIYACQDVSETDVLDSAGESTVSSQRPAQYPMEVLLIAEGGTLRVDSSEVWDGGNFCA